MIIKRSVSTGWTGNPVYDYNKIQKAEKPIFGTPWTKKDGTMVSTMNFKFKKTSNTDLSSKEYLQIDSKMANVEVETTLSSALVNLSNDDIAKYYYEVSKNTNNKFSMNIGKISITNPNYLDDEDGHVEKSKRNPNDKPSIIVKRGREFDIILVGEFYKHPKNPKYNYNKYKIIFANDKNLK